MSGTHNYLKTGDINRSTRSREIVDYLADLCSRHPLPVHLIRLLNQVFKCQDVWHHSGIIIKWYKYILVYIRLRLGGHSDSKIDKGFWQPKVKSESPGLAQPPGIHINKCIYNIIQPVVAKLMIVCSWLIIIQSTTDEWDSQRAWDNPNNFWYGGYMCHILS